MVRRVRPNKNCQREAGIAYIMILLLLATLTSLSLAFLHKTSTQMAATANRGQSMQVHYLAESAANHAMWRLLNDPAFAPAADTYYMHSFANGRYGYKVRKPTATTFATVATVGATGDVVSQQSYVQYIVPSNVFAAYGDSTHSLPQYRRLIGAGWGNPGDISTGNVSTIHWVELEGCPTRKELVGGVIDSNDDIKLAVWDGTAWGHNHTFTTSADRNYKCFDIAYESQSGDALVVGRLGTDTPLRYNIWNGSSWAFATPQIAFSLTGGNVHDVVMASQPGGDEILIAVVTSWDDIQLVQWDGSAFHDLGTIETEAARSDFRMVEIIYEHQSGDAMVVWSRNADDILKFRMWNGATLGSEGGLPDFHGNENYVIRGAADSDLTSDYIVIAAIDNFYDINVAIWDGDAWIDSREIETAGATHLAQSFDVAWEAAGEDVVIAWAPWGETYVRFLTWKKGTLLADSAVQQGPDFLSPWVVRLLPISGTEKIVLLGENSSPSQLRYSLWNGAQWKGDPAILLEPNVPVQNDVAFDLAEANVPRTGGTGSGVGGNLAPVVDAGPDQTIYLPTNQSNLDGTVTDDGLPDPPAAVTTIWSVVSGPGTVNFDDASLVDTVARFSHAGEYVLKLTADDSDLSAFDEVTIIVKAAGCTEQLLYVVKDSTILTSQESQRKTLMEGWGWTVTLIDDDDTQVDFDAAAAANDAAYISQEAVATTLGSKLNDTPIGVVNENKDMLDDFGFSTGLSMGGGLPTLKVDPDHYITSAFGTDTVAPYVANEWYQIVNEPVAAGVDPVGTWVAAPWTGKPALMALSQGALLIGGGTAAGRRVQIPWGSGQGATPVYISSLSGEGRGLIKRSIAWAGGCYGCNADFTPDNKVGEFSTSAYGSSNIRGITYFPVGKTFNGVTSPAGGGWIIVDDPNGIQMTDMAGNLLTSCPYSVANIEGVTLVKSGTMTDHLAILTTGLVSYVDLNCNTVVSMLTGGFGATAPKGIAFIDETAGGLYSDHLAILDTNVDHIFIVDQGGGLKHTIDFSHNTSDATDVAHMSGTNKLLFPDPVINAVFMMGLDGTGLGHYFYSSSGATGAEAMTFNPLTCDHVIGADGTDNVVYLNSGAASDTDPPTPDPMTWSKTPAADSLTSISMMATTATDPSGVEYYFECTAGGGNDSGWQAGTIYVDSGLSPDTLYTYRVKARDKSANQNETGWSAEASATTLSDDIYVNDITMGYLVSGVNYFGQATVWIQAVGGTDISGAVVSGDWSGDVSGTSMGTTGSDGRVTLESPSKKNGGTFTFTITNVTKLGYNYNPSLNVETSDTIIAP